MDSTRRKRGAGGTRKLKGGVGWGFKQFFQPKAYAEQKLQRANAIKRLTMNEQQRSAQAALKKAEAAVANAELRLSAADAATQARLNAARAELAALDRVGPANWKNIDMDNAATRQRYLAARIAESRRIKEAEINAAEAARKRAANTMGRPYTPGNAAKAATLAKLERNETAAFDAIWKKEQAAREYLLGKEVKQGRKTLGLRDAWSSWWGSTPKNNARYQMAKTQLKLPTKNTGALAETSTCPILTVEFKQEALGTLLNPTQGGLRFTGCQVNPRFGLFLRMAILDKFVQIYDGRFPRNTEADMARLRNVSMVVLNRFNLDELNKTTGKNSYQLEKTTTNKFYAYAYSIEEFKTADDSVRIETNPVSNLRRTLSCINDTLKNLRGSDPPAYSEVQGIFTGDKSIPTILASAAFESFAGKPNIQKIVLLTSILFPNAFFTTLDYAFLQQFITNKAALFTDTDSMTYNDYFIAHITPKAALVSALISIILEPEWNTLGDNARAMLETECTNSGWPNIMDFDINSKVALQPLAGKAADQAGPCNAKFMELIHTYTDATTITLDSAEAVIGGFIAGITKVILGISDDAAANARAALAAAPAAPAAPSPAELRVLQVAAKGAALADAADAINDTDLDAARAAFAKLPLAKRKEVAGYKDLLEKLNTTAKAEILTAYTTLGKYVSDPFEVKEGADPAPLDVFHPLENLIQIIGGIPASNLTYSSAGPESIVEAALNRVTIAFDSLDPADFVATEYQVLGAAVEKIKDQTLPGLLANTQAARDSAIAVGLTTNAQQAANETEWLIINTMIPGRKIEYLIQIGEAAIRRINAAVAALAAKGSGTDLGKLLKDANTALQDIRNGTGGTQKELFDTFAEAADDAERAVVEAGGTVPLLPAVPAPPPTPPPPGLRAPPVPAGLAPLVPTQQQIQDAIARIRNFAKDLDENLRIIGTLGPVDPAINDAAALIRDADAYLTRISAAQNAAGRGTLDEMNRIVDPAVAVIPTIVVATARAAAAAAGAGAAPGGGGTRRLRRRSKLRGRQRGGDPRQEAKNALNVLEKNVKLIETARDPAPIVQKVMDQLEVIKDIAIDAGADFSEDGASLSPASLNTNSNLPSDADFLSKINPIYERTLAILDALLAGTSVNNFNRKMSDTTGLFKNSPTSRPLLQTQVVTTKGDMRMAQHQLDPEKQDIMMQRAIKAMRYQEKHAKVYDVDISNIPSVSITGGTRRRKRTKGKSHKRRR